SKRRVIGRGFVYAATASCALLTPNPCRAIDVTWLGGNGSWQTASNWSGGAVPNNTASTSFRVFVNGGSITTYDGSAPVNIAVDALTVNAGTVQIRGSLGNPITDMFTVTDPN